MLNFNQSDIWNKFHISTCLISMRSIILLISLILPGHASAECVRFEMPNIESNNKPVFDGIGSFGPLHMTLTLECLSLLGTATAKGQQVAVLIDENRDKYHVRVGDYVGENHGLVEEIKENELVIRQLIYDNDEWVTKYVNLSNTSPAGR